MKIEVSTYKQIFYTFNTNYNKTFNKVYFIFCDNNHVIPVHNNGMERLGNPILIEPYSRTVDQNELFQKCSAGNYKVTEIILDNH